MWFLGAGASVTAGVPSAEDLTWRFKLEIYCSREHRTVASVDLADPAVKGVLQTYFDGLRGFPALGADDEYAAYFEAAYPNPRDRRAYIDPFIQAARHSYGHRVLAAMMSLGRLELIWTTNFDRCVEDAAALIFGSTGKLVVAELDTSDRIRQATAEGRWPALGKLHGDFQSVRLKNTPEELRRQDGNLQEAFVSAGAERGLALIGYSGRDDSIMDALAAPLAGSAPYPGGVFWFCRESTELRPSVEQFLAACNAANVDAHLIEVPTFDELAGELLLLEPALPDEVARHLQHEPRQGWKFGPPLNWKGGGFPLIRLNALPLKVPAFTRLIDCEIGGMEEVLRAVDEADSDLIVGHTASGVLVFESDVEAHRVFDPFNPSAFDVYDLQPHRLRFDDSMELGMCYEGLVRALIRERPLLGGGSRRSRTVWVDPNRRDEACFGSLKAAAGALTGVIPGTQLAWSESLRVSIEYRLREVWLCIKPRVWAEQAQSAPDDEARHRFLLNRQVKRYNPKMNDLLSAWIDIIVDGSDEATLSAFGDIDGINAAFGMGRRSARSVWKA